MYPDPALSLMTRFRAGDPAARAAVREISARAAFDPAAKRAARMLAQHCPCPVPAAAAGCAGVRFDVPNAANVGAAWDGMRWIAQELRPHSPIRPGAEAYTLRKAYRGGLDAIANM